MGATIGHHALPAVNITSRLPGWTMTRDGDARHISHKRASPRAGALCSRHCTLPVQTPFCLLVGSSATFAPKTMTPRLYKSLSRRPAPWRWPARPIEFRNTPRVVRYALTPRRTFRTVYPHLPAPYTHLFDEMRACKPSVVGLSGKMIDKICQIRNCAESLIALRVVERNTNDYPST